ncbi:unnamed protein product [Orchesella dallaii]|uniref:F-box domain-containing protein n=1 Tax=Orchesella dallaii TaxID=48710 RepID=A0ABP1RD88_9HEXA
MEGELEEFEPKLNPNPLDNPVVLDAVFKHLPLGSLCSCRMANRLWNSAATIAIRKSLNTRLLLCADTKCATELKTFISVFSYSATIPYTRAILILDHLPSMKLDNLHNAEYKEGEMQLLLQLSELFSDHFKNRPPPDSYSPRFKRDSSTSREENAEIVKMACDLFSHFIENLIINLTLHQDTPQNIEYWLSHIYFPNLSELNFHITRTSPDNLSQGSLQEMFKSLPNLRYLGIRKLTKKGDQLFNAIILALTTKPNLARLKSLSIEAFTDDKFHLEILLQANLHLQKLSMIYLGGEVRFIEKMELIKDFLRKCSTTLQHLYTHLPLFSSDHKNFPKLPSLKTLKIEKVYREFSFSQSQLFGFNFTYYFPNIEKIIFKDYDLWKNMQLKTFSLQEVIPCQDIQDISLPDLCFDAPLLERYFMKFPNLRKLSIIVSYVNRYQRKCSFCMVYAFLPLLEELNIAFFEMDLPVYDHILTGISDDKYKELVDEGREPEERDRELAIVMLKHLRNLKITYLQGKKVLGITDISVYFAFLQMKSLRQLTIGASLISNEGISKMGEKIDVTIQHGIDKQSLHDILSPGPIVPENRDENVHGNERPFQEIDY